MIRFPQKCRMTLIEVLVAMSVLLVIMSVLAMIVHGMNRIARVQRKQSEVYQEQRLLMDVISQDLNGIVCSAEEGRKINCWFLDLDDGAGMKGLFVTSSGLGLTETDCAGLMEVGYELTSDSRLVRHYTTCGNTIRGVGPVPPWDFYNIDANTTASGWGKTFATSVELATSVDSFYIEAFAAHDGHLLTNAADDADTSVTPAMVVVTLKLADDVDNTVRTFRKKLFLKQGR